MERKGEVNSNVIWIIVIFIVIACAIVFFIVKFEDSNSFKQIYVSQDALLSGVSLSLEKGDSFIIDFAGLDYNFSIKDINSSIILIQDYNSLLIELGKHSLSFDLEEDGIKDVLINLIQIQGEKAELYLEAPSVEKTCIESWNCSDWSICLGSFRERVCVDTNSCGSELNKPIISENC
jgi:hypothetical protein